MEIKNFNKYKIKWNLKSETDIKPGLENIQAALEKLGNPQEKHKVIHVAGTNGKGSTIAFLTALAKEHGLAYASFTSPSIVDVHDQIQINSIPVTEKQMDKAFSFMHQRGISGMLTDFELLTVTAFVVFETMELDIVFIEAGMGGRLDSTNVMKSSVAVIPSISIDHTYFLGDTLEKISWHKAGILKHNSQLVIGFLVEPAKTIVYNEAKEKNAKVLEYNKDFQMDKDQYTYEEFTFSNLNPQMIGQHQQSNMALAITALLISGFVLEESSVQIAVKDARLPGRMEKIRENLYMDGAHNQASTDALVETLQEQFPNRPIHFVVGILKDKDYVYMLRKLEEIASSFEFVNFQHERALNANILYKHCLGSAKSITLDASQLDLEKKSENTITIVTGSFYFITEVKEKTGIK
ncbi:dihydrofolate synthase / folylpolyglutamate synthase [Psychrobacillus sp. OK028]|uniref:bifunctional folylpolyglutamate synthase/dihydrofolate synthase n=1 Tax=Psychrobacillus sp. OK028 TaxID=1884359 RepID=UPI00088F5F01|nr:folylpolyglutamate synthase/dihydrofolate synthase family protein [Psychrobacillus sp. OK028]SDM79685.1 dihydrofolate synthase / folylpolyglutamate synthase [Psychrobacillus sp. OK028]